MKPTPCPFEEAVTAAVRSDAWTPALRDHVSACASCQETFDVLLAMQRLAAQTLAPVPPPYAIILLRAEFARRQELRARREAVLTFVPAVVVAVLVVGLFCWNGAPPQSVARASIDLVTHASGVLTSGLGLAMLLALAMLAFVLTEESSRRER
jgi:predicted anti-sigma-YlaC factor YlaD